MLSGILRRVSDHSHFSSRSATFGFISQEKSGELYESYGERALLTAGAEYLKAASLLPKDRQLSVLSPYSREGFIFGLLAPVMIGADSYYSPPSPTLLERIRTPSPTRLLCPPAVAMGLANDILRRRLSFHRYTNKLVGKQRASAPFLPSVYKKLRNRISERLLCDSARDTPKAVTVVGDLPSSLSKSLFDAGVYHTSVLSFCGCPLAGYRHRSDPENLWRLPSSLTADMCNVSSGGVGSLTFRGVTVADGRSHGLTFFPWQYRREPLGELSIVSDLYGFSVNDRRFFVKGRVNF